MFAKITTLEGKDLIDQNMENEDFIILDLRTSNEFLIGHLQNSRNLNFYAKDFRSDLNKLDKTKMYLIYCRTGFRSGVSLKIMEELNFQTVYDMGGIVAWMNAGLPVLK